jgi:alcohol dehydrogenase YqhD (iron-dependent ADH family)
MENFTYFNPTRIHFGRGQIAAIDKEGNEFRATRG